MATEGPSRQAIKDFQRADPYVGDVRRDDRPRNVPPAFLEFLDENRSAGKITRAAEPTQLAGRSIPFVFYTGYVDCTGYVDTDKFRTKCPRCKIVHKLASPEMLVSARDIRPYRTAAALHSQTSDATHH